ncbi:hypothetical protein AALA83_17640 [Oscillospiraceae bacterium 44-5]
MASRFMKIKRVIIPFMTLVVMTSQLAGCATMTSDEMLKSMNESPDVSIEYAIPDPDKQSLDASGVINVGDQQFVSDSDSDSDEDEGIGLIENQDNQEKAELSGDELIEYFQKVYDIHTEIHSATTEEGLIQEELKFLAELVESDNYTLPSDYEAQYRAWRPAGSLTETEEQQQQPTQQGSSNQNQGQQSKPSGAQSQKPYGEQGKPSGEQSRPPEEQSQKPSGSTQTQQSSQPSGGEFDYYDGYGSYNAMIDAYCEFYPELSREEIIKRNPDPSTITVDEETVKADMEEGRLHRG